MVWWLLAALVLALLLMATIWSMMNALLDWAVQCACAPCRKRGARARALRQLAQLQRETQVLLAKPRRRRLP